VAATCRKKHIALRANSPAAINSSAHPFRSDRN